LTGCDIMVEMPTQADYRDAAETLRKLLNAVERGEIDSDTPAERRTVRRIEGLVASFESLRTTNLRRSMGAD
jgi:hypothetical protein